MLADRGQLCRVRRGPWFAKARAAGNIHQISQPGDMVEVRVREKNIEPFCLQIFANAVHAGASIEHDADFRQHQASRLPPAVGK